MSRYVWVATSDMASVVTTAAERPLTGSLGEGKWMKLGLCRQVDPDLFFPADRVGMRDNGSTAKDAKRVCALCPVRRLCLEFAIRHPDDMDGVWGGTTRRERRALRRRWRHGDEEAA